MSDGFPPFRPKAAAPKGQVVEQKFDPDPERQPVTGIEHVPTQETRGPVAAAIEDRTAVPEVSVSRCYVCTDCGSHHVREAVLIGNEVYVKLS